MRRLAVALGGLVAGAGMGLGVGGCSGYFQCATFEHPLEPGTLSSPDKLDYTLVLGADGVAVETYTDSEGEEVRAEYSVADPARLP